MNCIVITGANRGIGLELAKQYYAKGWHVIACSRHPEETEQALSQHTPANAGKLSVIKMNVTNPDDLQRLNEFTRDLSIDILFNNAGVRGPANVTFGSVQTESFLDVFKVNTIAPLMLAQTLIKQIERSNLKIIANMSSKMGSIADNHSGGRYIYRASKSALNAITKSMEIDLKSKGITVITLHPGWVKTDMGGPDAPLPTEESVQGIRKILANITLDDSGSFLAYNGEKLMW